MCVKSRRLDVAFTCLGNMGNVRALQSLRRVASKSVEQKLALLAIQLGMPDEAEQIYVERQMYGELARFYEVQGRWEQAIEVVEKHDRMGLKSVYHRYALCLEEQMAYERAMEMFEKAGTAR